MTAIGWKWAIRLLLIACLVAGAFYGLSRQSITKSAHVAADERHLDVAVVETPANGRIPVVFQLTNRSQRIMRILGIQRSCTCMEAAASSDELAPGAQCTINATVAISAPERTKVISCVVSTDDPDNQSIRYSATVSVVQPIEFTDDFCNLGPIRLDRLTTSRLTLTVTSPGDAKPHIKLIQGNFPQLTAQLAEEAPLSSELGNSTRWQFPVNVALRPDATLINVPLFLRAVATIDQQDFSAETVIAWQPESQFLVSPSRVVLPVSLVDRQPSSIVTIRRRDGDNFEIVSVSCLNPRLAATFTPAPELNSYTLTVKAVGDIDASDRFTSMMSIATDSKVEPVIQIPAVAFATNR
jgi:hypothetical protein